MTENEKQEAVQAAIDGILDSGCFNPGEVDGDEAVVEPTTDGGKWITLRVWVPNPIPE
jgi:hypothetical protein